MTTINTTMTRTTTTHHSDMTQQIIFATGAVIVVGSILAKFRALRAIQRAAINVRAFGLVLGFAARAAWRERTRWHYCVEQARRDA